MKKSCLLGAVCTFIFIYSNIAMAYSFTPLGDLPGDVFASQANGVSSDGSVVVGLSKSALGDEAFRWTSEGGMVGLGIIDDVAGLKFYSYAYGVSGDGSVVVGRSSSVIVSSGTPAQGSEAFRWTSDGGMVGLSDLAWSVYHSHANGVSSDGSVVVGSGVSDSFFEAFRWTSEGGMVRLGNLPGGAESQAYGVSSDGSVVVGMDLVVVGPGPWDRFIEAFRWTSEGGMVGLGDLEGGSFYSHANGVSSDGSVVVGQGRSALGDEAFRWTSEGGMVGLGDLEGGVFISKAYGVSSDGSVVVGHGNSVQGAEAFRWTSEDGMESVASILTTAGVDLTGWILGSATGVSADGNTIVGSGINPDGLTEAWIANVSAVPAPPAASRPMPWIPLLLLLEE